MLCRVCAQGGAVRGPADCAVVGQGRQQHCNWVAHIRCVVAAEVVGMTERGMGTWLNAKHV